MRRESTVKRRDHQCIQEQTEILERKRRSGQFEGKNEEDKRTESKLATETVK